MGSRTQEEEVALDKREESSLFHQGVERKGWIQMPADCRSNRKKLVCAMCVGELL